MIEPEIEIENCLHLFPLYMGYLHSALRKMILPFTHLTADRV